MAEMEDRWLSVDEIGKYLGVSNLSIPLYVRADNGNGNGNGVSGSCHKGEERLLCTSLE